MGHTYNRYSKAYFDDEKDEKRPKQAGKKNHSRRYQTDEDLDIGEFEDDKYFSQYEHMLKKR